MRYFNMPCITLKEISVLLEEFWRGIWDRPGAFQFWKYVQIVIKSILGIDVCLEPSVYILGNVSRDVVDKDCKYLLRVLLLIAKKCKHLLVESTFSQYHAMER
ncbi:hypothetical protein ILYODFUR_037654 [Ilyodon furcidens]|uniref:Uncharacterized protein n=1 Tax=Ilyodon furcidens TaxID=33524 RepID=A0ABV0TEE9_9TELE